MLTPNCVPTAHRGMQTRGKSQCHAHCTLQCISNTIRTVRVTRTSPGLGLQSNAVVPKVGGTAPWGAVGLPRWALIGTRGGRERCYYHRGGGASR
jgi:hypothetical protein